MTQLAVILFAVMFLAALVFFVDALTARRDLTRARAKVAALRIDVQRLTDEIARLNDIAEVNGRPLADNVEELRRAGVFGDGDPHRKK